MRKAGGSRTVAAGFAVHTTVRADYIVILRFRVNEEKLDYATTFFQFTPLLPASRDSTRAHSDVRARIA
jgi:hypothetical protein